MYRCKSKYLIFISTLYILTITMVNGQGARNNTPVNEMVYVHLDKQVYVSGETIKYKAYLFNTSGMEIPCSKVLYFTLTGSGIENVLNWRINIDSSSTAGSLLIPDNIKPGIYVLTAYTNWMRNSSPSTYFTDRIMIVSLTSDGGPATRLFNQLIGRNSEQHPDNPEDSETALIIRSDRREYNPNERVRVELDLKHTGKASADLSLSVNVVSPFDSLLDDPDMTRFIIAGLNRKNYSVKPGTCLYKIEDRGFILSGRLIRNPNTPAHRCDVWLAVADSVTPRILYAQADTTGEFRFFLDRSYDNKELIIQLIDPFMSSECKLEVFGKTALMADSTTIVHNFETKEQAYITSVKNIRLVEAIYGEEKKEKALENHKVGPAFLNVPNRVIIPSEYAEMRNFREIASNIVPEVRFGTRRDEIYLEVLSPNINAWKDNNTILLNGVPFTDLAYVSTLGTKEIRRIEVIQPNVLFGNITLPGLVSIYTYDHRIPENYLKRNTVRFQNTVIRTEDKSVELNSNAGDNNSRFPDFRNSLFWDPFIKITSGNKMIIEFPALLLTGKFIIRAEGITTDGIPVSATESFHITEQGAQ